MNIGLFVLTTMAAATLLLMRWRVAEAIASAAHEPLACPECDHAYTVRARAGLRETEVAVPSRCPQCGRLLAPPRGSPELQRIAVAFGVLLYASLVIVTFALLSDPLSVRAAAACAFAGSISFAIGRYGEPRLRAAARRCLTPPLELAPEESVQDDQPQEPALTERPHVIGLDDLTVDPVITERPHDTELADIPSKRAVRPDRRALAEERARLRATAKAEARRRREERRRLRATAKAEAKMRAKAEAEGRRIAKAEARQHAQAQAALRAEAKAHAKAETELRRRAKARGVAPGDIEAIKPAASEPLGGPAWINDESAHDAMRTPQELMRELARYASPGEVRAVRQGLAAGSFPESYLADLVAVRRAQHAMREAKRAS